MTFSIVIPSHSRVDLLERCLHSIARFAPSEIEIIVVDDGSRDSVVSKCAERFAGVTVIRNERPRGFAIAANRGVSQAKGDIVELLNDDTEVTTGWAERALERFRNSNIVAVAPLVLMHPDVQSGPILIDSAGDGYDSGGYAFKRGHGQRLTDDWRQPSQVWGVSAAAGFYRRDAFLRVGGFPSDFGAYFEDVDLSHRLNRVGVIWYEPASVVWHRVSASYGRIPSRRTLIAQSRNEERVYWRNAPSWRSLPRHAAVLMAKSVRRLCDATFEPWLIGRFQCMVPDLRACFAQSTRKINVIPGFEKS
jgi:GT2 family glycosyltransferase